MQFDSRGGSKRSSKKTKEDKEEDDIFHDAVGGDNDNDNDNDEEDGSNSNDNQDDRDDGLHRRSSKETSNDLFKTGALGASTAASQLSREGASHPLAGVYLKNHPDELVFVPLTQELGFMTEDMLEAQQQQLEEMGTSAEGALARAKLQTASLLSDMEAFKAANPDAHLEDFVKWHSPNDWIVRDENGAKAGFLSARMTDPDNLWQTTWTSAQPVAAAKQKQLFNYEAEAMKVLHYIENVSVADLLQQIMPTMYLMAVETFMVQRNLFSECPPLQSQLVSLQARIKRIDWNDVVMYVNELAQINQALRRLELMASTAISLFHKIGLDHPELVARLLLGRECELVTEVEREAVNSYFVDRGGDQVFSDPPLREYVLRAISPQPTPGSRVLPHRLYARISEQEFRLAEAYSHDTLFF